MPRLTWPLLLLLAPALSAQAAAPSDAAGAIDAPALFAASCAQCHGLDGSGTGPTVLDRPARNFKEGGFSFGNTVETIARTIAYGIPGSPMPAFEPAFSIDQMRALAEYVVTLGPPVKEVTEAETLLHVTDRPLIVRGILPPLAEGGPMIPRGLLIGTPDGLTFQYAADDVRLLVVRQGDFVKRTDWGGRGGTPLEPLGQVVWSEAARDGIGRWFDVQRWTAVDVHHKGAGEPLSARLLSTSTLPVATLTYALASSDSDGVAVSPRAIVVETVWAARYGEHAGFSRHFEVRPLPGHEPSQHLNLALRLDIAPQSAYVIHSGQRPETPISVISGDEEGWWGRSTESGVGQLFHVRLGSRGSSFQAEPEGLTAFVGTPPEGNQPISFEIETFVLDPWKPELLAPLPARATR